MTSSDHAFWLQQPCPTWCDGYHSAQDARCDRLHHSPWVFEMTCTLAPLDSHHDDEGSHADPPWMLLGIHQHAEAREPVVEVSINPGIPRGLDLSPKEAERLGKALLSACALIDGGSQDVTAGEWVKPVGMTFVPSELSKATCQK